MLLTASVRGIASLVCGNVRMTALSDLIWREQISFRRRNA